MNLRINIVKHSLHVSVIVDSDMVIWCGHGELCIHDSTLQLQQSAVTLLILTASGGVATLPGQNRHELPATTRHCCVPLLPRPATFVPDCYYGQCRET